jgi:hypothetical protein
MNCCLRKRTHSNSSWARLAFKRVANCRRRASAGLRLHDEAIVPLLAQASIDSEAIEAIIDATAAVFELFSWEGAAATGSRAMMVTVKGREPKNWLKNEYAGLRAETRGNCEAALAKSAKRSENLSKLSWSSMRWLLAWRMSRPAALTRPC